MEQGTRTLTALEQADIRASKHIIQGMKITREDGVIVSKQTHIPKWSIYTNKELYAKAKEIYDGVLEKKHHIHAGTFILDEKTVTIEWIKTKMEEIGLTNKDLHKQLGLTSPVISRLFCGKQELSRPLRVMFFYYIMAMGGGQSERKAYQDLVYQFVDLHNENERLKSRIKELEAGATDV